MTKQELQEMLQQNNQSLLEQVKNASKVPNEDDQPVTMGQLKNILKEFKDVLTGEGTKNGFSLFRSKK